MNKLKTLFAAGLLAVSTVTLSASYTPTATDNFQDILTQMSMTQDEFEAIYGVNYVWVVGDELYDNFLDFLTNSIPDASADDISDFIATVPDAAPEDIQDLIDEAPEASEEAISDFLCLIDPTACVTTPPATTYILPEILAVAEIPFVGGTVLIHGDYWKEISEGVWSNPYTSQILSQAEIDDGVALGSYISYNPGTEFVAGTPGSAAIEVAFPIEAARVSDADFTTSVADGNTWLEGHAYTHPEIEFVGGYVLGSGGPNDGQYWKEFEEGVWYQVDSSDPTTKLYPNAAPEGNGVLSFGASAAPGVAKWGIEAQAAENIVVEEIGIRAAYADGFTGAGVTISSMDGDAGEDHQISAPTASVSNSQVIIGGTNTLYDGTYTIDANGFTWNTKDFHGIAKDATIERFEKKILPATAADIATMVNWDNDIVHFGTASPLGDFTGNANFQAISDELNALNTDALIVASSGNYASDGGAALGRDDPGTAFVRVLSSGGTFGVAGSPVAFNRTEQVLIVSAYDFNESRTQWNSNGRMVMDSGFTGFDSAGTPEFSAAAASARVAGKAALLMQKFPGLDAAGVASRIIDTADTTNTTFELFGNAARYIGQIQYDSAIHGNGKVNLLNALSPQF